jgi:hypothetical protein
MTRFKRNLIHSSMDLIEDSNEMSIYSISIIVLNYESQTEKPRDEITTGMAELEPKPRTHTFHAKPQPLARLVDGLSWSVQGDGSQCR